MATIDEFSNEPKYTIKAVCTQTGIRAVTLRAWERRHDLLSPYRSDNRYRLYSDRDIALLRWIKNRVDNGVSISNAVNELHSLQKNGDWPEAVPTAPVALAHTPATPPQEYIRKLYQALIKHDENRASDLFRETLALFDLNTLFTQILVPTLVEIGDAWYRGEIRITTEHFASSYLRGKLLTLMQAYPSRRNAPYIIVGCAPTEQHELGSLMMAVMLRSQGFRIEYLGPDIPVEDLVDYVSYEHPAMIVLSATSESAALEMQSMQPSLNKLRNAPLFGYGGNAFNINPQLRQRVAGIFLGETLDQSIQSVRQLLSKATAKATAVPA